MGVLWKGAIGLSLSWVGCGGSKPGRERVGRDRKEERSEAIDRTMVEYIVLLYTIWIIK